MSTDKIPCKKIGKSLKHKLTNQKSMAPHEFYVYTLIVCCFLTLVIGVVININDYLK